MATSEVLKPTGTPAKAVMSKHNMFGPTLQKVVGVFCEDGKRRTATITGQPTTFFTVPARISYKGKTVTGEVCTSSQDNDECTPDYVFYARGKYAQLLGRIAKGQEK